MNKTIEWNILTIENTQKYLKSMAKYYLITMFALFIILQFDKSIIRIFGIGMAISLILLIFLIIKNEIKLIQYTYESHKHTKINILFINILFIN
jgi:hypothetical protein